MQSGENISDQNYFGDFLVDANGKAANEEVVTYMSKETKEKIETEFEKLGIKSWQELMGRLINERHVLMQPNSLPDKIFQDKKPDANFKTTKHAVELSWIHIVIGNLTLAVFLIISIKLFGKKRLPKIEFG